MTATELASAISRYYISELNSVNKINDQCCILPHSMYSDAIMTKEELMRGISGPDEDAKYIAKDNCNEPLKVKENNMTEPVKNVLFLAPGYQYAMTVIANQSKELDRKKIPYNASKDPKNLYIRTDKVHVEIVYSDPVKWTSAIFQKRDAVFGKKELVDKAHEHFFQYIIAPKKSLSKYIRDMHNDFPTAEPVKPRETYIPEIKNAYFNNPMTVVIWEDGTKTMVRCQEGDVYSAETGLALCIAKKALGNMPNFNNVFKKWVPEEERPLNIVMDITPGTSECVEDVMARIKSTIWRALGHDEV